MSTAENTAAADLLPEVLAFRQRFPIFQDKVHLASNAMGAVSDMMEQAHRDFLDDRNKYGASWEVAIPRQEELRKSFADFIGAKPGEIAICYSASQAMGTLATCFDWYGDRQYLVVDDYAFPSVAQLWRAQQSRGAKLRRVAPNDEGLLLPEHFDEHLDDKVKAVSAAQVCYKNGHLLDVKATAKKVHDAGAIFIVDAYQGCGSRKIDVQSMGIDVLVTGTVKYMLGSPGLGLMYVKEELLDELHPTITGWFGQQQQGSMNIEAHEEADSAIRFQSGTPSLSPIYDSLAGLELIKSIGMDKIECWIDYLTAEVMRRLKEEGFVPATPSDPKQRAAQVAIRAKDVDAAVRELANRGITSTGRDNNLRTAWHFYNTPQDIDILMHALDEIRDLLFSA